MAAFSIYLPAGWWRFDLADQPQRLDRAFSQLVQLAAPTRQPAARALVEREIRPMLADLAQRGATTALMGFAPGDPIQPVIVCQPLDVPDQVAPSEWLVGLVGADPTLQPRELPELLAVRGEESADVTADFLTAYGGFAGSAEGDVDAAIAASTSDGLQLTKRRVTWIIGDPNDARRWLAFTLGLNKPPGDDGRDLADGTIAVFDAMMATVRWAA